MKPNRKARHLAKSLYTVATSKHVVREVGDGLSLLAAVIKKEPECRALITTHRIDAEVKAKSIRSIFGKILHPIALEFLLLVSEEKLLKHVSDVAKIYQHLMAKDSPYESMEIYTAEEMSQDELQAVVKRVEDKTVKSLQWKNQVDSTLIGGIKLRIGNVFLDGSVSNRLTNLRESLLSG